MKKNLLISILLLTVFLGHSFGQAPDTVNVPVSDNEGPVGALSRFILGDTTSTGERVNINRYYRLLRGERYLLNGKTYFDFPIRIIADDDPSTQPPVVAPFPLDDGSIPRITFYCYEDSYFKNIYFFGVAPTGQQNGWDRPLILGDSSKMVIDNCIIDGFVASGVANIGENTSLFIEDCIWRNDNMFQFGGQVFFNYGSAMDTISIINTTFFNGASYFLCNAKEYVKYVRFEHNTLFNNITNPFYVPYLSDGIIQNNIFYNAASGGETPLEHNDGWYDWDDQDLAVFSIDTLPTDWGLTESDRKIKLTNNAYFWNQKIQDFWSGIDTLTPPVWLNERTTAMFADDVNYPDLINEDNMEADPGFNAEVLQYVDSILVFLDSLRISESTGIPYASTPFPGVWPLETFEYTNSDLLTASTLGFPLGDLNWFPDKKAEWEQAVSGVGGSAYNNSGISLFQNYPNPFHTSTTIRYSLNKKGHIKLVVYDINGRLIKTLYEGDKQAGTYSVTWNITNTPSINVLPGVYFLNIESNNYKLSKKMLIY